MNGELSKEVVRAEERGCHGAVTRLQRAGFNYESHVHVGFSEHLF